MQLTDVMPGVLGGRALTTDLDRIKRNTEDATVLDGVLTLTES